MIRFPRLALVSGPRFVSRAIASLRAVALQVHFERGVVAEPPLAPRVVVGSGSGAKFFRCEDVIQTPTAIVAGDPPPSPARLALGVAVQRSERIAVTELSQPWNDPELGLVPLGPALGS
jgi:hypothetical protein